MNTPSDEQSKIINAIESGYNVVVDACAGSGKSTTILSAAIKMPDKKFLQITYNSSLRREVKDKVKELGLKNVIVHTYHSLAVAKYSFNAHTDSGIRFILNQKLSPTTPIIPQNVIVLDETQDMSILYFSLIVKFLKDMNSPCQLMILGDYKQGLYEFKGADIRFLTNASDIWQDLPLLISPIFKHESLQTSYRITRTMADFVNRAMLNEQRLISVKDGPPVIYIRNSNYFLQQTVVYHIQSLISNGVSPNEIFVLGASVKGPNSQIRRIENALVQSNIPCYVPMFETDKIDERVMEGKIVFSTFHCVKGRQRAYVFVVGFDQSYLRYFAFNLSHDECPNTLYVACTRATKQLFLLETDQYIDDRPLSFLQMSHHDMIAAPFVNFKGQPRTIFYENDEDSSKKTAKKHFTTPTELLKFIPEHVLEEISPLLDSIFINVPSPSSGELMIPTMVKTKLGFYEDVSDLNGIAIPSIYYDYLKHHWKKTTVPILYEIIQNSRENLNHSHHYLRELIRELNPECNSVSDYLYMANIFVATQEKLYFKIKQIQPDEYVWLKQDVLVSCKTRLQAILGPECELATTDLCEPLIEHTIIQKLDDDSHSNIDSLLSPFFHDEVFRFAARADLITEKTLWEIKCTSAISLDHRLQLVIYAWLILTIDPTFNKDFKIFNIKTGEILQLSCDKSILDHIMIQLLKGKYCKSDPSTKDYFVKECRNIVISYFS